MPNERSDLKPEVLSELLARLDQVLDEAARLRRQVTRQLEESRLRDHQKISSAATSTTKKKRRR